MGIFCDVKPHIQRLTVFFKIAVYYCICRNSLFDAIPLRLFYFPYFLHLDWQDLPCTVSTTCKPETVYTGRVISLVMIGKYVCPSSQKQRERLEYYVRQKYTGASVYCPHPLIVHSITDYMGSIFCHIASRHSYPRKTWIQRGSAAGFARGCTRESGRVPENICAVHRCTLRENNTSKQCNNVYTFVCVFLSDFCIPV